MENQVTVSPSETSGTIVAVTPRRVTIYKSKLAQFKGLGKDINFIATHFGITPTEARKVMADAGLSKAKAPEYTISLVDDITTV